MTVFQPVPKPATVGEYLAVRHRLVDTNGDPLVLAHCAPCRGEHFTVEPCLKQIRCPDCKSTAQRCHRPSGHDADTWHKARIEEFDRLRDELEAAGHPQVAKWLPTRTKK